MYRVQIKINNVWIDEGTKSWNLDEIKEYLNPRLKFINDEILEMVGGPEITSVRVVDSYESIVWEF